MWRSAESGMCDVICGLLRVGCVMLFAIQTTFKNFELEPSQTFLLLVCIKFFWGKYAYFP